MSALDGMSDSAVLEEVKFSFRYMIRLRLAVLTRHEMGDRSTVFHIVTLAALFSPSNKLSELIGRAMLERSLIAPHS